MTPVAQELQWSPALSTGIDSVDSQHQRLLDIFNQAARAQARGVTRDQASALLEALFDYTRYHFREEAQLMLQWPIDPAHRRLHLKSHEGFIAFLSKVEEMAERHPAELTVELLAFLAQWLLHHIMGLDARMAEQIHALQSQAPQPAARSEPDALRHQYLIDVMGQLTAVLGQRTFDLLDQRRQLFDLQDLYRALLRSADVLIHSRSEQDMLGGLCSTLARDTPFHTAWVGRPGASQVFEVLALAGDGGQQVREAPAPMDHAGAESIVARAWTRSEVVVCNDTQADPGLHPWHAGFGMHGWASILAVPVERAQRPWAVLAFVSARRGAFDDATVALCSRIASLLGHGLDEFDRKSALQDLQNAESRRARSDVLTGLPNRLALDEYLPGALARADRRDSVVAVGVLDLDDFKPVNDRLGHAAGDVLLQRLGQALRLRLRRGDFLARLGGDELVVVFEDLDVERHAEQLARALERLHGAVQEPFDLGQGRSAQVGLTMGLALYPQDAKEPDTLLRLADAAMYANKLHKADRACWWRIGAQAQPPADEGARETALDLFGAEASALLSSLERDMLQQVAAQFAAAFYDALASRREHAAILRCLSAEEFEALKRMQAEHLGFLLQPSTTRDALDQVARRIGRSHALVGVSAATMEESFALYEDLLRSALEGALISSRQRYRILRVASGRLRLDVQTQLAAIDQVLGGYFGLLETRPDPSACRGEALRAALQRLSDLPGIRHAMLFRPDARGVLRDEAGAGPDCAGLSRRLEEAGLYPSLAAAGPQRGPIPLAWFTRRVQVVDACALDARLAGWRELARQHGWRSAAAIPVSSGGHTDGVLVLFGAYPHQFASHWARSWLELLRGQLVAQLAPAAGAHAAVDSAQVRGFRELLYAGALQMWVQPVVDLQTGATVKVEALARLYSAEAGVLSPAQFLPAFGEHDLDALFVQGLEQALEHLRGWREAGIDIGITVNLAASTLCHADCASWIEQALRRAQVEPGSLTLELLESEDLDPARAGAALAALDALGVRLALDDLGAGYGSLQRLAALPIDTVKIDQSLVRELPRAPVRTIRLLAALVRIGRQFAQSTVVEGLEDPGFCEAARLLGARLGQGYALARPMPASAFVEWLRGSRIAPADGAELHSWAGALAFHWAAMHDLPQARHPGALAACPLGRFLREHGVDDPQALRWHEELHHAAYASDIAEASTGLLNWIAARLQQQTDAGCAQDIRRES